MTSRRRCTTLTPERNAHARAEIAKLGAPDLMPAIDPTQYQCGETVLDGWVNAEVAKLSLDDILLLFLVGVADFPTYDALIYGSDTDPAYALTSHQQVLGKTFRKLQSFWNIDGSSIELMAMHGQMLTDRDRVYRLLVSLYGLSPADASETADAIVEYATLSPGLRGGATPLVTLNAFAFAGGDDADFGYLTPKIVMGDGMLQAYDELGYASIAPQLVLAHEYGHQTQFAAGLEAPAGLSEPEATRYTELHADAAAAYFASHPRGLSMQTKRVNAFLRVFYSLGDCLFTNPSHHGTPNQRERAGEWAYQIQEATRPKARILTVQELWARFGAAYPMLTAPDA